MENRVSVTVSIIIVLLAITVAASFLLASYQPVESSRARQATGWQPTPVMDQNGNV
jgi:hypothetical protein